jgi:hypothetical protein
LRQVIIRILDTDNSVLGDLDLKDFSDFPLVITKGIVNLDNLKARTGTYTKTFKVPNTKNNSNLLNSIDDINSRKDYKDALNRKPCVIIVDGAEIEKGFVQTSRVYNGFKLDSFELVFFGNNVDWVKSASELNLKDISFNFNTQTYNQSGIDTANAADSDTYDHAYPYISRSGDYSYKPVYYLRSIIERGLNQLGWNISSDFLTTDAEIKKLVCDFDLKFIVSDADIQASKSRAEITSGAISVPIFQNYRAIFNDDVNSPNEDTNNNYNPVTGIYTVPQNGSYTIISNIVGNRGGTIAVDYNIEVVLNGSSTTTTGTGTILSQKNVTIPNNVAGVSSTILIESQSLSAGDEISIYVGSDTTSIDIDDVSNVNIYRKSEIEEGDTFNLNELIPRDFKLMDVVNDFTRLFNVYYWTDIKTKTVYFEPRDSFFLDNNYNWTDKLDLSNKYEIDYVSSYKRNVTFKYRELNNDDWLKGWQDANKRTYGKYNHVLPNRFAEGTDTIELSTFCAGYTIVNDSDNALDNGTFDAETSPISIRLWSDYVTSKPIEEIEDYRPKIYQFNVGTQTSLNGVTKQVRNLDGNIITSIPYGIFESYDNVTSGINLSFTGETDGLFYTYYSKMFKNIEEGGRLIAYFDLDNVDIENLDFRNTVYIDYPSEIRGRYLIESVIDYNPLNNNLTKVSLFKFENLGSVAVDGTQQGNNSAQEDNGSQTPTPQPIYVEDGVSLIEVYYEDPVTGLLEPVYR